jgi:hypothetical protein
MKGKVYLVILEAVGMSKVVIFLTMQSKYYDESINSSFLSEFGLPQETLHSLQLGLKIRNDV